MKTTSVKTEVVINGDDTVSVTGNRDCSLFAIMASGNTKAVNTLDLEECLAVYLCVQAQQWAGDEEYAKLTYGAVLGSVRDRSAWTDGKLPSVTLGAMRQYLVLKAGDGCNAPHDSWIDIAAKVKRESQIIQLHPQPDTRLTAELFGFGEN